MAREMQIDAARLAVSHLTKIAEDLSRELRKAQGAQMTLMKKIDDGDADVAIWHRQRASVVREYKAQQRATGKILTLARGAHAKAQAAEKRLASLMGRK